MKTQKVKIINNSDVEKRPFLKPYWKSGTPHPKLCCFWLRSEKSIHFTSIKMTERPAHSPLPTLYLQVQPYRTSSFPSCHTCLSGGCIQNHWNCPKVYVQDFYQNRVNCLYLDPGQGFWNQTQGCRWFQKHHDDSFWFVSASVELCCCLTSTASLWLYFILVPKSLFNNSFPRSLW